MNVNDPPTAEQMTRDEPEHVRRIPVFPHIVGELRSARLSGGRNLDVHRALVRYALADPDKWDPETLQKQFSAAFGLRFEDAKFVFHWDAVGSPRWGDEDIESGYERGLVRGSFAGEHLVPPAIRHKVEEHQEWLRSDGKAGRRFVARDLSPEWGPLRLARWDLTGSDWSGISMREVHFERTVLERSRFEGTSLLLCSFLGASLARAAWHGVRLSATSVESADFSGATVSRVEAFGVGFTRGLQDSLQLSDCLFSGCSFGRMTPRGALLARCSFQDCRFYKVRTVDCTLTK